MKRSELKIFIICTILVMFGVALAWIAGRKGGNTESIRTEGTAMGTAISVVTYGGSSSVHDEIYRKLDELEKQYLSFRVKGSTPSYFLSAHQNASVLKKANTREYAIRSGER